MKNIAEILLETQAVKLSPENPFKFASGILSPIYCDNRVIISYPEKRKIIRDGFAKLIEKFNLEFDVIAGTATAGIPHAAWLSELLDKPMVYVRGESKSHGRKNRIEGVVKKGDRVLIVEDLVSTAGSLISVVEALREEECIVDDCIAIFSYGMKKGIDNLRNSKINLYTLENFENLIETAVKTGYIKEKDVETVMKWKEGQ